MSKILIFSGTSDGRMLAERLAQNGHNIIVCVATEYGEQLMPDNPKIKVHCGRMDEARMHAFMSSCGMDVVVDATHPYAKLVSENIRRVCEKKKLVYYRLIRDSFSDKVDMNNIITVENAVEAAKYLETVEGNIFVSTGSKEISCFLENISDKDRIFVRVLPTVSVLEEINRAGLLGKQIICMQGPFSRELNYAMFVQTNTKYLVTKESGSAGGFIEKVEAAKDAGMQIVLIKRPSEEGYSSSEILRKFGIYEESCISDKVAKADFGLLFHNVDENKSLSNEIIAKTEISIKKPEEIISDSVNNKKIFIVGIGMGSEKNMTREAYEVCSNADLLIGADRMLEAVLMNNVARRVSLYKAEEILSEIERCEEKNIVIVMSGDVGFYSGTKKLIEALENNSYKNLNVLPGISTAVYMAAKLKLSWDDMKLVSLHGRNHNILDDIKYNKKVFALVGGKDGVAKLCQMIEKIFDSEASAIKPADLKIFVGSNLSYENEKILSGSAKDFVKLETDGVSAVIILNENIQKRITTHGISDDLFIREKVPMTKEEVRVVSLAKLKLNEESVVYDIGAGSGSVSIECALKCPKGKVYAIERKTEATELIERNCEKFGISNVEIIKACAPDIDFSIEEKMEIPTHAFIGGSGGNLSQILDWLYEKNSDIKIVINAIALETVSEIVQELKKRNIDNAQIVSLNVAKAKKLGGYNMMMGNNPVYVVSF